MTVSTIATIAAGLTRASGNQNSKATAVFNSLLASSDRATSGDVANVSSSVTLQTQIAQFRVASKGVAQAGSILSAADQGANEISNQLDRLHEIAAKAAAPDISAEDRAQLNIEFQAVSASIDKTAKTTTFGGESLLDGSSSLGGTSENGETKGIAVGSLTTSTLFKGTNPDVSTASGAKVADATVKAAQDYTHTQIDNIAALQDGLEFAASTLQSAIQNQDAATSTLDGTDFTTEVVVASANSVTTKDVTTKDGVALRDVQVRRLPPSLLELIIQ